MGKAAREFARFLAESGQTWWQVLPIGPTSYGDSPYQSFSTFAGNPYYIDLDQLAEEGLLEREEYAGEDWGADPERVDYGLLYEKRPPILRKAVERLLQQPSADYPVFLAENGTWIQEYALFMALKDHSGGKPWWEWEGSLRRRENSALSKARQELAGEVAFHQGVQYLFFHQWRKLKEYVNDRGPAHLCGVGLRRRVVQALPVPVGRGAAAGGGLRLSPRRVHRRRSALGQPSF